MRGLVTTIAAASLMASVPGHAQTAVDPESARAQDLLTSPLNDINLMRRDIPAVLKAALAQPYGMDGIRTCKGLTTAIVDLDVALGEDIDLSPLQSPEQKMGNSAASVAKSLIGSFIPFRGVIREVSGANAQERAWQRALYAGSVRRAFLKGIGEQRGCAYPARSAPPHVLAAIEAKRQAEQDRQSRNGSEGTPVAASASSAVQPQATRE